jgi:hypothetical protein
VLVICLVFGQGLVVPSVARAGTTYQDPSDPAPIRNRPLFDSVGTNAWPAGSEFARDAGSRYESYTRGLTGFNAGAGYAYGRGETRFGWSYELPSGGFGCSPTQPSGSTKPIGGGYVRVAGDGEQYLPGAGGTNNSIHVYVLFKNHECGAGQASLGQTTVAQWPHVPGGGSPTHQGFDVTIPIPAGARQLMLVVGSAQGRLRLDALRIYVSGPGQPPPTLPGEDLVPDEQLLGLGDGVHGATLARFESDPVNTAIGNYAYVATDLQLPGRGLPFTFQRVYNSLDAGSGRLGVGWRHTLEARLTFESGGVVRFHAEDGAQYVYTPDGSGGFDTPRAGFSTLSPLADGT